jgi:hypothetical protein
MQKMIRLIIICFTVLFLVYSCASTIKTTGVIQLDSNVKNINIECTTPDKIEKFSNNLCAQLKTNLESYGFIIDYHVYSEMSPTTKIDTSSKFDLIIKISHLRVSLYNGMPCGTLMNIAIFKNRNSNAIWDARVETHGTNITGPGNPKKVSMEIIDRLKQDGFKF